MTPPTQPVSSGQELDLDAALRRGEGIADAVLLEGYLLYPYRASAAKNKVRWQFGVLVPPRYAAGGTGETATATTEFLLEPRPGCELRVRVRFLQLQQRAVSRWDGRRYRSVPRLATASAPLVSFQEGVLREVSARFTLAEVLAQDLTVPLDVPGAVTEELRTSEDGRPWARVVRRRWALHARLSVHAETIDGPYGLVRVRLTVANTDGWRPGSSDRSVALRRSLLATHCLVACGAGAFVSLLEPPEWAADAAAGCHNVHAFPVLLGQPGQRSTLLSAPIILYDYPQIAPESPGNFFDATEMDELLSLRTLTLTDAEKAEARGTDPRAAALVDRVDGMPQEVLERLHGAVRYLRRLSAPGPATMSWGETGSGPPEQAPATAGASWGPNGDWGGDAPPEWTTPPVGAGPAWAAAPGGGGEPTGWDEPADGAATPWWSPGADASASPDTDTVPIGGVDVGCGSQVVLRPRPRGSDAQDLFLAGRLATVRAVYFDVDGGSHLAVTVDDDPAVDLHLEQRRYRYFRPDEVEPMAVPR